MRSGKVRIGPTAICFLFTAALAASASEADTWHIGWPTSVVVHDDDCELKMRVRGEGRTLKVEAKGCYDVNEDENEIIKLDPGGSFEAEERRGGRVRHHIEIHARHDGTMERTYERDGAPATYDAAASEWMADVLQSIVVYTGTGLEQHLERVLKREGVDGALRDIAKIDSDYSKRKAYVKLLQLPTADATLADRVVHDGGHGIDSDHELAELLLVAMDLKGVTPGTLVACAEAAHQIDSDYEHRRVLAALTANKAADGTVAAAILRGALDVDSDHERCELLRAVTEHFGLVPTLADAYFTALQGLDSDYEAARALLQALDKRDLEPEMLQRVAAAAGSHIDSDYHKAQVLREIAERFTLDAATRAACVEAARKIDSEYERNRVLSAIGDKGM